MGFFHRGESERAAEKYANEQMKTHNKNIVPWRIISIFLAVYDLIVVNLSYLFVLWLRFDAVYSSIPERYLNAFFKFCPIYSAFCLIVFFVLRLYRSLWGYASFTELIRVAQHEKHDQA